MYYETRNHTERTVADAFEAARLIKTDKPATYEALCYDDIVLVSDSHIDDQSFGEVAVLQRQPDGSFRQIETITAAWIKTVEDLADTLRQAKAEPLNMGVAALNLGAIRHQKHVTFTCGCCGNGFKSTVEHQRQFDQDDGYGICQRCE